MANTVQIVLTAKDEASKVIKDLGGSMDEAKGHAGRFSESLARIRDVALGVYLPQLGAKFIGLGKDAVSSAADFEQYRVSFETMLGGASKAQEMLAKITDFAKRTPFELPEVVQGAKSLLAYGIEADKLLPTLESLGNITAGVGKDKMPQLVLAYGQVRAATKLTGQELRQFTEAGVPLLEVLAKQSGKTAAQIKDDMVAGVAPSFEDVDKALASMSKEGGRFFNLMEKQSHTFGGVMSNIKDSLGQVARAAVGIDSQGNIREGSIFALIKRGAEDAMPVLQHFSERVGPNMEQWMKTGGEQAKQWAKNIQQAAKAVSDYLGPKVEALWHTIRDDLAPVMERLWKEVGIPLSKFLGEVFVGALGLAIDVVNGLFDAASKTIDWLQDHTWVVATLAAVFGSLAASMALGAAFDAIMVGFATLQLVTIPNLIATFSTVGSAFLAAFPFAVVIAGVVAIGIEIKKAIDAFNILNGLEAAADKSIKDLNKQLDDQIYKGKLSLDQAYKIQNAPGYTGSKTVTYDKKSNTYLPGFASGGYTGPGGENDIAGIVHRGEYVLPKEQVDQRTGTPKIGRGITINQYNTINSPTDMSAAIREMSWRLAHAA